MLDELVYDGPDRDKRLRTKDCVRYARERLGHSKRAYYKHLHPYVSEWMQHVLSVGEIRKGPFLDYIQLLENTPLNPGEAAEVWSKAPYFPDRAEVRDSFISQVRSLSGES